MLYLASASPRRRELLSGCGIDFTVKPSDAPEEPYPGGDPGEYVKRLARAKAAAVARLVGHDDTVVGSDTIVFLDGRVLGKPADEKEACAMLRSLSGKKHDVYTGVAILGGSAEDVFYSRTRVEFYPLKDDEIRSYVASGEPMDKAGAYGIQKLGSVLVKGIEGDYFTVVGLPVAETVRRLKRLGY